MEVCLLPSINMLKVVKVYQSKMFVTGLHLISHENTPIEYDIYTDGKTSLATSKMDNA